MGEFNVNLQDGTFFGNELDLKFRNNDEFNTEDQVLKATIYGSIHSENYKGISGNIS